MANRGLLNSSIGRKFAMALSALLLVGFLALHLVLNALSVFSPCAYDTASEFMGYNWIVQFIAQPILVAGTVFHFVMGMILESQNRKARPVQYAYSNKSRNANSSWLSRNMAYSGLVILAFLVLHFVDFWFPEMGVKFSEGFSTVDSDTQRFYPHLMAKFANPLRVLFYILAFVALMMHLLHGFQSAFQSVGFNNRKYTPFVKAFGKWFAILVPVGFILIAIINYLRTAGVLNELTY